MKGLYAKRVVMAFALLALLLSGCVSQASSFTIQINNGSVKPKDLYIRYADSSVVASSSSGVEIVNSNYSFTNSKSNIPIVGGFLTDGTVSWVPDLSYFINNQVIVDLTTSRKPTAPAAYAELLSVKPVQNPSGYVEAKFKVYDANDQLVTGQTEVFAHTDSTVYFYNNDTNDYSQNSYTRTDLVSEGMSSYTKSGEVAFVFKPNGDLSLPWLTLYSGVAETPFFSEETKAPVTVTFNNRGGTGVSSQTVYYKGIATQPADPTKDGDTFVGWYKNNSLTQPFDFNTPLAANTTLYAKWQGDAAYTVTYNSNDATSGTVPSDSGAYMEGAAVTVSGNTGNLVKTGYTFAGWNTEANGSGTSYAPNALLTMQNANVTLYAQWTSANALLAGLTVNHGTLDPAFSATNFSYDLDVDHAVSSLTLTLTKGEPNQTITVTGATLESAVGNVSTYQAANLGTGENSIQIAVESQNQAEHQTYQLAVHRAQAPSSNANLSGLSLSTGTLSPAFTAETTSYSSSVAYGVSSLTVTASAADDHATLTINGNLATSGQPSAAIPLRVGGNSIVVIVTAQNLGTKMYTIDVTRAQPPLPSTYPVTGVSLDQTELGLKAGGEKAALHATVNPSYATNSSVTWSSSNPQVATVSANGVVTPLAPGTATITVTTVDQAKTATCTVIVKEENKLVGLEASEKTILLKPNQSASMTVYAVYSNGDKNDITTNQEVSYRSSSRTVASVTAGVVKAGKKEGKTTITIAYQGEKLAIPVQVSKVDVTKLEVQPADLSLEQGEGKQLQLQATFSNKKKDNVTEQATWSSSDSEVATIDEDGKVKAIAPGTAVITAAYGGKTAELSVTVSEAQPVKRLAVSKKKVTVAVDKEQAVTLTAYARDNSKKIVTELAEWSSDDETIATVENGVIHGVAKGTATIEAAYHGKRVTIVVSVLD